MSVKLTGMNMKSTVLTEKGIYKAIFHSHKKEAKDVASALGFPQARDMTKYLNSKYLGSQKVDMTGSRTSSPISDKGISSNIRRVTTLTEKIIEY